MVIYPGDIISHAEMNVIEGYSLQRGMNFRIKGGVSVFLMSTRKGSPYDDEVKENGKLLIYEGHDAQRGWTKNPKSENQPLKSPTGILTENGKFYNAASSYKKGESPAELIRVYEKIKKGLWVYNGIFELIDAKYVTSNKRKVFKFYLKITDKSTEFKKRVQDQTVELKHNRMIPTSVKLEVWKRDKGKCVTCGSKDNLHFDHILPFSKGGTSLKAENIQLLCARHNLEKKDKIQ
ncbi:MAG: HNH endonuclease signature motif containing protein [Chitinophagaceae bacterium]